MPDASHVALEGDRIVGAILITHWMGMPLVAELGVAKDRRGRGLGRALLETAMGRLAGREEPRLALYFTVGNDPLSRSTVRWTSARPGASPSPRASRAEL